ncbi:hypothetical protein BRC90_00345 [Halobacteriales archaeon QS_4_69_34]|jgi:hypothetical protein|nr:MAG: hypothetical protein BRC90_00345 [Halobacteriales archaeon QS_4_69_34]
MALVDIVRAFSALNVLLLVGLGYVWGRNFLRFRSKHTLGLCIFAAFLLVENALAVYLFAVDPTVSAWIADPEFVPRPAQIAMSTLRVLEFGGIAFLTWVTWD